MVQESKRQEVRGGTRPRNPLRRRVMREFRQDLGRNLALFLFMVLIIGFVSGFLVADTSMQEAYDEGIDKYHLEDGHFATDSALTAEEISKLKTREKISVAPLFYKDTIGGPTAEKKADDTIRVFNYEDRRDHNQLCLMEGELPKEKGEAVLDRLYCENNDIAIGDTVQAGSTKLTVVGTVAVPDYSCLFKNNSDMMFDASHFSYAVVTEETFETMGTGGLNYRYIWYNEEKGLSPAQTNDHSEDILDSLNDILEEDNDKKIRVYEDAVEERLEANVPTVLEALGVDMTDPVSLQEGMERLDTLADDEEALEDLLEQPAIKDLVADVDEPEVNYVTDFVQRGDNQAITFTKEDMGGDLAMMLALLYILMAVLAFIFGISTKSTVEREAQAIGTLRASGYTRGELVRHYMVLPLIMSVAAALIGNLLGYTLMKDYSVGLYYHSYSLPTYETVWDSEAFWLTTVVPALIVLAVDFLVLVRALRLPPLQFLRGELRTQKKNKVRQLKHGGFFWRFRLRVMGQNVSAYIALFCGLAFASLILIFGTGLVPLLNHFKAEIVESKIADYQYILKAETETHEATAEKYCITTLIQSGNDEEITLYGVEEDSAYLPLDFSGKKGGGAGTKEDPASVYMSDNYMKKFGYEVGDVVTLEGKYDNAEKVFRVAGSHRYDATLALFLSRGDFNRVFDEKAGHYSGYFSDTELTDIDEDYIASVITEKDLTAVANQLTDSMGGMMYAILVFSIVMYMLFIYLLTKVIVDRNAGNIALLKILGYTNREAGRLYNYATGVIVVLSLLLILPLVYNAFDAIWSRIMMQMNGYLPLWLPSWMAPFLVAVGLLSFFLLYPVLLRRIRNIPPGEVLKGME